MSNKNEFQESIKNWMGVSIHFFMSKMHRYAKQNNLSVTQMNCMFKMKKHGPFQVNQVSTFFDMSKPAASQLLDKLVQRDLVSRKESSTDRRVKFHSLTSKGEDLMTQFFVSVNDIHSNMAKSFNEEENIRNKEVLDTLTNRLLELSNIEEKEHKCSK